MIITRHSRLIDENGKATVYPNGVATVFFIDLQSGVLEAEMLAYMCKHFSNAGYASGAETYPHLQLANTTFVVLESRKTDRSGRLADSEEEFSKAEKLFNSTKAQWFNEHYYSLLKDYEYHRYSLVFDYFLNRQDMQAILLNEGVSPVEPIDKFFWDYNRKTGWHLTSFVGVLIRIANPNQDAYSFRIDNICTKDSIYRARAHVAWAEAWSLDISEMTAYDAEYLGKSLKTDVGYLAFGRYYGEMSWNNLHDIKIELIMKALDFLGV